MTKRCLINVEPIEPSGVPLTMAEPQGLFVFGQTADDAVGKRARVVPERLLLGNCTGGPDTDAMEWLCAGSLATTPIRTRLTTSRQSGGFHVLRVNHVQAKSRANDHRRRKRILQARAGERLGVGPRPARARA